MPLVLDGVPLDAPASFVAAILGNAGVQARNAQFLKTAPEARRVGAPERTLFVVQREFASCLPRQLEFLGARECTNGVLAFVRNARTGKTACAHLDDAENLFVGPDSAIPTTLNEYSNEEKQDGLEFSLVGCYDDGDEKHAANLETILRGFHDSPVALSLRTACVSAANTHVVQPDAADQKAEEGPNIPRPIVPIAAATPLPRVRSACMDTRTGRLFPAVFDDVEPELVLRIARLFTGGDSLLKIFGTNSDAIKVGPFDYQPPGGLADYLESDDATFLTQVSATPSAESSHFVAEAKASLQFLIDNPDSQAFFANGAPTYTVDAASKRWKRSE